MVIHFFKEDGLTALKANVEGNIKHYKDPTNAWVYDFFEGENPFLEYKSQIEDFKFDMEPCDSHDQSKQDVENIIRMYSSMKNLSDTQATDERLWAGLSHGDFWEYIQRRWNSASKKDTPVGIKSRYFLNLQYSIKRALAVNALSRMWWAGRLTYDPKRKDPFELTRYFEKGYATMNLVFFSSNYTSSTSVSRGLLSAMIELENEGYSAGKSPKDALVQATRYLNIFGGTHILDYYSEEEIKDKVLNYMRSIR